MSEFAADVTGTEDEEVFGDIVQIQEGFVGQGFGVEKTGDVG